VLHHPAYRKKYELNLKREFPRIPFYENFFQWSNWGKQLMNLHINYETVEPYGLQQHHHETKSETKKQKQFFTAAEEPQALYAHKPKIKVKLKADKAAGIIEIDELTFLGGISAGTRAYNSLKADLATFKTVALAESVNFPFFTQYINDQNVFEPLESAKQSAEKMLKELVRWTKGLKLIKEDVG
jgi:hypothetical protein